MCPKQPTKKLKRMILAAAVFSYEAIAKIEARLNDKLCVSGADVFHSCDVMESRKRFIE
jgi:hypothetical protein